MIRTHSRYYNYDTDYEYQERLKQDIATIKELLKRKQAGEAVNIVPYIEQLKRAGIFNSEGKLKEIYKTGKRT